MCPTAVVGGQRCGGSGVSAADPVALATIVTEPEWTGPPSLLLARFLPRREGSLGDCLQRLVLFDCFASLISLFSWCLLVETWWWLDGSSLVPKTDLPRSAFSYNASGSQIYVAVLRRVLVGALPEDPRAIARSLPPSLAVLVLWLVIGGAVSGGWTGVAWCRRLVTPKDGSSSGVPNGGRWRTALGVSGVSAADPIALAPSRRNLAWTGPPSQLSAHCLPRRELLHR